MPTSQKVKEYVRIPNIRFESKAMSQVGKAFADDDDIMIAKMDATLNDVTSDKFDVRFLLVNMTPFALPVGPCRPPPHVSAVVGVLEVEQGA